MNKFPPPFGEQRPASKHAFTPIKDWRDFFSIFGLACGLIGAWAVIANNLHYFGQDKNHRHQLFASLLFSFDFYTTAMGVNGCFIFHSPSSRTS